jgi:hypothetical protein
MNILDHISGSLETIFWVNDKIVDGDPESYDPGSGMEKFRSGINIWDPQHCFKLFVLDPLCNDDIKHPPMTVLYVTGFFLRLMSAHLVILGRVIPSSPPMDMNQCRYTNFYKSHPLILNYHEKVSGYGPQ